MANNKRNSNKLTTTILNTTHSIHNNTKEELIIINESKARLLYDKHINKNANIGHFFTFLSLFITFLITLLTSDFKDLFGIKESSTFLFSLFLISCIISFVATIISFIKWIKNKKKYNVETFISDLKDTKN